MFHPKGIASLLKSGKYSDLKLICESSGRTYDVHKAVLCSNCDMFESTANWPSKRKNDIPEIHISAEYDPDTVERMLSYLYTGDYDDEIDKEARMPSDTPILSRDSEELSTVSHSREQLTDALLCHIRVNAIAQCYMIRGLQRLASEKFGSMLEDDYGAHQSFLKAIEGASFEVLTTDNDYLLGIITRHAIEYIQELVEHGAYNIPIIQYISGDIRKAEVPTLVNRNAILSFEKQTLKDQLTQFEDRIRRVQDQGAVFELSLQGLSEANAEVRYELDNTKIDLNQARAELDRTKDELAQTRFELDQTGAELEDTKDEFEAVKAGFEFNKVELEKATTTYIDRIKTIEQYVIEAQNSTTDKTKYLVDNFDKLRDLVNKVNACRNAECGAPINLNCYITRKNRRERPLVPEYELRCGTCKCRQELG